MTILCNVYRTINGKIFYFIEKCSKFNVNAFKLSFELFDLPQHVICNLITSFVTNCSVGM